MTDVRTGWQPGPARRDAEHAAALVVEARRPDGAPRRVVLVPVEVIDFYPADPVSEGAFP
jgi:hypothetical protein